MFLAVSSVAAAVRSAALPATSPRMAAALLELRALCLNQNELHGRSLTVKLFAEGHRKMENGGRRS